VTRVETLRRDPYAIYAERILELVPMAPLGDERGAREIGTAIHEAWPSSSNRIRAVRFPMTRAKPCWR